MNSEFEMYSSKEIGLTRLGNEIKTYKKSFSSMDYTPWLYKNANEDKKHLKELPPCTFGTPIINYFNDATVRTQLHIPTTV